jgi:hypothetical protein
VIYSRKYNFVFIKTLKTAGTSIEVTLARILEEEAVVTPIFPEVTGHRPRNQGRFFNHVPAHTVRSELGEQTWNSTFSFCVERDPWEKVVSLYCMRKAEGKEHARDMDTFLASGDLPINYPLYTEPSNPASVIVTRVLKYEALQHDWQQVVSQLGIPFPEDMTESCKASYRRPRISSRAMLTSSQTEFIANVFAHEIGLFGYRWDKDPCAVNL